MNPPANTGTSRLILLILLILTLLACPVSGESRNSAADTPDLQDLLRRAEELELHRAPYWHILLHYNSDWPGWESEVDDPRFFLAPSGKRDPAAELRETLTAFFHPIADQKVPHARCRFPARFAWLQQRLGFHNDRISLPDCHRYREWLKRIDAGSVTLVFPNYYLNTPASMFGHTLLRINSADPERPALLGYAVNYAALVDHEKTGPLEYAFKGVFGGFHGVFTIAPYYLSVRAYNDMEQRDIWEYDLELSTEEIQRLMRHLWELKQIYFDYYFFKENCSYHLLSLLEAARPGLSLRSRHLFWTIPVDTVREVVSQPGLVAGRHYRPSRWSRFRQQLESMSPTERALALSLVQSESLSFTPRWEELSPESRSQILDLLAVIYSLQGTPESRRLREQTLSLRAKLQTVLPDTDHPQRDDSPDSGHATAMTSLSAGHSDYRGGYGEISLRPSLHGLLDRPTGFIPDSEAEFFHVYLRHYEAGDPVLQELTLARVSSLNPRGVLHSGFSWKLDTGFYRSYFKNCDGCLLFRFNPGGGVGFSVPGGLFYTLGEFHYNLGAGLDPTGHAALGVTAGVVSKPVGNWRALLENSLSWPAFEGDLPDLRQEAGLSYTPLRNHAFRLDWRRENETAESRLSYSFFF